MKSEYEVENDAAVRHHFEKNILTYLDIARLLREVNSA